jgi:diguanylate cyclase (GGDEF)-like protein/PAS domain S-box-containing protein
MIDRQKEKPQIRILVIEDDVVDRMAVRRALAQHPEFEYVVQEAETARQGLQLAAVQKPDCILLDYHLPDLNGLEFLAELADEVGEIPVPVMMLTGADNAAVAVEAMRRGARDYLVKDTERQYLELVPAVIERVLREQRALDEKRQTRALYQTLVEQIPAITYIASLDEQERFLYVSPQIKLLGFSPEEWIADPTLHLRQVHAEDHFRVQEAIAKSHSTGEPLRCEYRLRSRKGVVLWFRDEASLVRDESGRTLFFQGILVDITEAKRTEEELRQHRFRLEELVAKRTNALTTANEQLRRDIVTRQEVEDALFREKEKAQITLESIADAVITTDAQGLIEYLNPVAEEITGWRLKEARQQPVQRVCSLINETTREALESPVERCLREGRSHGADDHRLLVRRDGNEIAVTESASPIYDRARQLIGTIIVFHDVTQSRNLARQLSHQATHDALTGLVNRLEFDKRIERALESVRQGGAEHALCYLDLDRFKMVNDTCGHAAGDELLRQISKVLHDKMRQRDTLARLGGDEFGVLLEHCPPEMATQIAAELVDAVHKYQFVWEGKAFTIGVSAGVVAINGATESLSMALSAADAACYIAKEKGRNRVHLYQADDSELTERRLQMAWVARITHALDHDLFKLCCQPIAPLSPGHAGRPHYEILLRMVDDDGKLILPSAFLPVAERYDLMSSIDRWVIRRVIASVAQRRAANKKLSVCEINLSAASIRQADELPAFIGQQLQEYGVPGDALCFEITEKAALADPAQAAAFAQAVKKLGCLFALDNFGSGLSSFGYLKNLPVDFLKIDGSFIKSLVDDRLSRAMADAINHVAHVMAIQTVAECAETEDVLKTLRDMGVDHAQGYAISDPKLLEELVAEEALAGKSG